MAGDPWPLSFFSSLAALLYLLLLMLVASRSVKQRPDWLYLSLFGALALYHTGNSLRYFLYPTPTAWFPVLLLLVTAVPGAAGLIRYREDLREPGAPRSVVLLSLGLLGLLVYGLLAARLARTLETSTAFPATLIEAALVMLPVVLAPLLLQFARRWMAGQVSEQLERLESLQRELRSLALGPQDFRSSAADRLTAFFGFPVHLDEQGELQASPPHPLSLRDSGALRGLRVPVLQALETSRLVSERVCLEHELAEREKTAALGRMVAFIAHRLKNPLSAIHALVQVIPEQEPRAAESCAVIRGEIKRLSDSVNDLLLFTTPAAPATGSTSARVALEEARALFAADAQRRDIRIEVEAGDAMLPIASAPLHDILVSLLGNALDAAPSGSTVRVTYSGGVLAVEDAGTGVADGLTEKIFDPFFTLKAGGTGLGLALARRRAREAGGDLRCVSPALHGSGARFEVTFAK